MVKKRQNNKKAKAQRSRYMFFIAVLVLVGMILLVKANLIPEKTLGILGGFALLWLAKNHFRQMAELLKLYRNGVIVPGKVTSAHISRNTSYHKGRIRTSLDCGGKYYFDTVEGKRTVIRTDFFPRWLFKNIEAFTQLHFPEKIKRTIEGSARSCKMETEYPINVCYLPEDRYMNAIQGTMLKDFCINGGGSIILALLGGFSLWTGINSLKPLVTQ